MMHYETAETGMPELVIEEEDQMQVRACLVGRNLVHIVVGDLLEHKRFVARGFGETLTIEELALVLAFAQRQMRD